MILRLIRSLRMSRAGTWKPMCYFLNPASGARVSTSVYDTEYLHVHIQRKIEREDVVNGKLVPIVIEKTKRRGGKRSLQLKLSHEAAAALHKTLGAALKDQEQRRDTLRVLDFASTVMYRALETTEDLHSKRIP